MKRKKLFAGILIAAALVAGVTAILLRPDRESGAAGGAVGSADRPAAASAAADSSASEPGASAEPSPAEPAAAQPESAADGETAEAGEPKSPEDLKAEAEERAVDAFDSLTDRWMEPAPKGVSMEDIGAFLAQFSKVPSERKEECLQRALNLIPDENVMLLTGVLLDKSQPKELVELVFNDILNRDEDVKKPILAAVYGDRTHPCWADTAWILDVTGETPAAKPSSR